MKVHLIKWANVLETIGNDAQMLKAFLKFYSILKLSDWHKPQDFIRTFNSADIVHCEPMNRVVFNVGGNKYRLVCGYYFAKKKVYLFVKFVGSHEDYNKIDVCSVEMFKK